MFLKDIFASFLTSSELETISDISKGQFPRITEGIFDFTNLKSILANNMARFNRIFKYDKRNILFINNRYNNMAMPDDDGINAPPKPQNRRKAPAEDSKEPPPKRHQRPEQRPTFLGAKDSPIPNSKHCTHPRCISDRKQHTHTYADCGHANRASMGPRDSAPAPNAERYKNRPQQAAPRSANSARPKDPSGCFHCGALDHFINVCPIYKALKTPAFLAIASTYRGSEIQCLDTLIASVNARVCQWCLKSTCDNTCGAETTDMASAKDFFLTTAHFKW